MATVTVDEFCADVDAMFARVERGETIDITRDGDVIAVAIPPSTTDQRSLPSTRTAS